MKSFCLSVLLLFSISTFAQRQFMIVGTYTKTWSHGIYVYEYKSGKATIVDSVTTSNPSYLAVSPDNKFVYAVNENEDHDNGGMVSAFSFDKKSGHLTFINQQLSAGDDPCYITVDKSNKWVIVANYTSGTLSVLPVEKDGSLGKAVSIIHDKGKGVNKERQEKAHVHSTVLSADNHYIFAPDLGTDKVMIFSFNDKTGAVRPMSKPYIKLKDGSGPRHFIFHPNGRWAYVAQEMGGLTTFFRYDSGRLTVQQTISTLPKDYKGEATTADIHISPDGKFLYVSNRDQSNTIAIFRIDQATGRLTTVGYQSTLGKTPRNFTLDTSGNYLLAANASSDNIVFFRVNHKTGLLTPTGEQVSVPSPVCIKFTK